MEIKPEVLVELAKLEPVDKTGRYDFFDLNNIFHQQLGFDSRGCEKELKNLGYNIGERRGELEYCDFWHYQVYAVFSRFTGNECNALLYVGGEKGVDVKKLKNVPNEWQKMMLDMWNVLFCGLGDKNGWIRVRMSW